VPNGVTPSTPTNLVVGAGIALVDHAVLGATLDANVFRIERQYFTPKLNGLKGFLIGTDYITSSEGVLETGVPEISADVYGALWPASKSATLADGVEISEDDERRVPVGDYHDWELRVPRLNGGHFGFHIDNGLNLGNLENSLGDASVAAPRAEVHSRWDATDTTKAPHRIVITSAGS
jgi:hypothetical protein